VITSVALTLASGRLDQVQVVTEDAVLQREGGRDRRLCRRRAGHPRLRAAATP
jgi:hypothetical protein